MLSLSRMADHPVRPDSVMPSPSKHGIPGPKAQSTRQSAHPSTCLVLRLLALVVMLLLACAVAAEVVHLRLVVYDGDQGLRVLREVVREFERAHPGISVSLENVPYGSYFQKLLAQYAANVAPDVAMMDFVNFQKLARRKAILPLNPFFDQTPGFDIHEYYRPIVEAHSLRGQLYVLPRDIAPIGLIYYNKKMFDEAGLPYPDGSWTWDFEPRPQLREKCFTWTMQHLTKRDARGRIVHWGFTPGWMTAFADLCTFSTGGRYADDNESARRVLYDDPKVIRAYQFVADCALKYHWMPTPTEITSVMQSNASQLFLSGKVAMFQSGIWEVPRFREVLRPGEEGFFEWDITLAPAFKDGTRAAPTGGSGYSIMSSTRHPREAWLLVKWMAGEPGMVAMARAGLAQPAIRRLAIREPWIPGPNTPLEQRYPANRIATDKAVPYVVFPPTSDKWPEVSSYVASEIERIFNGTSTAEEALRRGTARAQARLDALLREERLPKLDWWWGGALCVGLLGVAIGWVYWPERGHRLTRREKADNRAGYLLISPWIIGMVVFTAGPMVLSLLMSLSDWDIIQPAKWRGLQNYTEAFGADPRFWITLRVSAVYTLVSVPLGIIGSLMLALLLNTKVRGMPLYRTCFYLPALASTVASALIWRRIFQPEGGLLNLLIYGADGKGNFLGLATLLSPFSSDGQPVNWLGNEHLALPALIIMSLWGVGGGMVILLAGLQGIPEFYYEAATLDGAGWWARFRAITLPLLSPSLFFTLVTGVIGSFQVFTQAFVMTGGGPNDATRFYMLHLYEQAFGSLRMGYASALAWVLFVVILGFTLLQFQLNRIVYYEAGGR